jgi:hypothetical protein
MTYKKIAEPKAKTNLKWLLALLTIIFFLLIGYIFHNNLYNQNDELADSAQTNTASNITEVKKEEPRPVKPAPKPIAATMQLKVPFTAQAPTANWDELHDEACEEASSIMAYAYFNNIAELPPTLVEKEIQKLTEWQQKNYNYYLSITTEETARMVEEVYGLKAEIVDISEEVIKQALTDDKLVIFPAQGQKLGNPNFTPPGPIYHMLVITGYDDMNFITNDPGTRRGFNYKYSYDTLYAAAGNWSHSAHEVDLTNKKIILVSK